MTKKKSKHDLRVPTVAAVVASVMFDTTSFVWKTQQTMTVGLHDVVVVVVVGGSVLPVFLSRILLLLTDVVVDAASPGFFSSFVVVHCCQY